MLPALFLFSGNIILVFIVFVNCFSKQIYAFLKKIYLNFKSPAAIVNRRQQKPPADCIPRAAYIF